MGLRWTERPRAGWSTLLGGLALVGCAQPGASRQDVDTLRAEVRALRDQQQTQQGELSRLRAQLKAQQASAPAASADAHPRGGDALARAPAPAAFAIPDDLRVVKLEPEAAEYNDDNTPQPVVASTSPSPRHHSYAAAQPLATDTSLKEPVLADLAPQPTPDPAVLDVQYKVALGAPDAITELERFAREHPEHPSADNALFEAGLRAEKLGDAARAARDFERAVREYPAGDTVADSLLHLAACDLTLNRTPAARRALEQLSQQYPNSAQAEAARVRLTDLSH